MIPNIAHSKYSRVKIQQILTTAIQCRLAHGTKRWTKLWPFIRKCTEHKENLSYKNMLNTRVQIILKCMSWAVPELV